MVQFACSCQSHPASGEQVRLLSRRKRLDLPLLLPDIAARHLRCNRTSSEQEQSQRK